MLWLTQCVRSLQMSGSSACDDALLNPASQSAYATRIRNCDAFDLGGYDSGAFWHAYGLMSTVELASAGLIRYHTQTRAIKWSILVLAFHYIVWIIVSDTTFWCSRSSIDIAVSAVSRLWCRMVAARPQIATSSESDRSLRHHL